MRKQLSPLKRLMQGFMLFLIGSLFGISVPPGVAADSTPFRLAFSSSMLADVDEAEARATMRAWFLTVADNHGFPVDPNPDIYQTVDELRDICAAPQVGGCVVTLPEYAQLIGDVAFQRIAVSVISEKFTEEYLLLTHRTSGLEQLEQLRGSSINVLHSPRMSMGLIWLDILLLESGLDVATNVFGQITPDKSPLHTMLPVFFSKADACLVTRSSFEVMAELNPQIRQQLQIIAASPAVVPAGFAFRDDSTSPHMDSLLTAMEQLQDSPAGQQMLQFIPADRLLNKPVSILDQSLALLERYRQLTGRIAELR